MFRMKGNSLGYSYSSSIALYFLAFASVPFTQLLAQSLIWSQTPYLTQHWWWFTIFSLNVKISRSFFEGIWRQEIEVEIRYRISFWKREVGAALYLDVVMSASEGDSQPTRFTNRCPDSPPIASKVIRLEPCFLMLFSWSLTLISIDNEDVYSH